jgi:hypothetical protein
MVKKAPFLGLEYQHSTVNYIFNWSLFFENDQQAGLSLFDSERGLP